MARSKLRKFRPADVKTVKRSTLTPAPYNPRTLDKHARKKLRESLERFGQAETLVWNSRTGNLVGGHQRLSVMDEHFKYPDNDYDVSISALDLTDDEEKALNIALNNPDVQGSYDLDALAKLYDSISAEAVDWTGWDSAEWAKQFGTSGDALLPNDPAASVAAELEAMLGPRPEPKREETPEEITARYREKKQHSRELLKTENDSETYFYVVFGSGDEVARFQKAIGVPVETRHDGTRHLYGPDLCRMLGIDLDKVDLKDA
jgi:ParB-like chromosome segregation protein Spo0J